MPPHLHPRSRTTSSLFATTVLASFLVVGLPHILPCPVPTARLADGEVVVDENGRRRRWKRKETTPEVKDGIVQFGQGVEDESVRGRIVSEKRECPVPKPGGILGEWLGFHKETDETNKDRRIGR